MKKWDQGYQSRERKHFDKLAEATGEIWWGSTTASGKRRLERRAQILGDLLSGFNHPVVLELGCGTGTFSAYLLQKLPSAQLLSSDISTKAIEVASGRCGQYKNARFGVADLTSMPYRSGTFEAVVGNSVLHHIPLEICLRESYRVLKPGGILFFFEPNMLNPQIAVEKNIRFVGKVLQNSEDETAFFRWSLARMLGAAGFQDVSVKPFDFLHPIVPNLLTNVVDTMGRWLERIPILREVSGSLMIHAVKLKA